MLAAGAFDPNGGRTELRASLCGSARWGYKDVDLGFEKFPLPDRWLTSDPATNFGIPEELAYLECALYRQLPETLARQWPERFVNAIPYGADLSGVTDRLMLWLLRDPASPLMLDTDVAQRLWRDKFPLGKVADLFDRKLAGDPPSPEEIDALFMAADEGVRTDILRRETVVIYASCALRDMAGYLTDRLAAHLPASAVRSVGGAVQQLEVYAPEARRVLRAARQYVDGPGYRYRAEYNMYGSVADALAEYIMEAPRIGG